MDGNQRRSHNSNKILAVIETPAFFKGVLHPVNMDAQKETFLKTGKQPHFVLQGENSKKLQRTLANSERREIKMDLLSEAVYILEKVKSLYGNEDNFLIHNYGQPISIEEGSEIVSNYLGDHGMKGQVTVYWTEDLACSAKIMWHGPHSRKNKPEKRRYTMLIKSSKDNPYMREYGVTCLLNHELGTHYIRMLNDGFQPWFSDRKKFDLRPSNDRLSKATEEGLATINTVLMAKEKYLWTAALLYYTACKAKELNFKDLFHHLECYVKNQDLRWKHIMRVKRSLPEGTLLGGSGADQVYFEGAVTILRYSNLINFPILYSGVIALDELSRVQRMVRINAIKLPFFMRSVEKYRKILHQIALANGLTVYKATLYPSIETNRKGQISPRRNGKSNSKTTLSSTRVKHRTILSASSIVTNSKSFPHNADKCSFSEKMMGCYVKSS